MPYRITITKIDEKELLETYSHYYSDEELKKLRKDDPDHSSYERREHPVLKQVETKTYEQTVDHQPPLMKVIEAFNSIDAASLL